MESYDNQFLFTIQGRKKGELRLIDRKKKTIEVIEEFTDINDAMFIEGEKENLLLIFYF